MSTAIFQRRVLLRYVLTHMINYVVKDYDLGTYGDFDRRRASTSLVTEGEASDLWEASAPGSSVGTVALSLYICPSRIYQWRRATRSGRLRSKSWAVVESFAYRRRCLAIRSGA